ncbi:MAG: Asp-tRNA(Asn)/Glu-tRNA(Gln) amidotransferase subunit GatC [Acidobacteriota bacterium]
MPGDRKTVTEEVVRKVAELSRLRLPDGELSLWADQLGRIVSYIDQIAQIPETASARPAHSAPTPVRADEARPGGGDEALERNAARRFEGFGVVPRVVGSGE